MTNSTSTDVPFRGACSKARRLHSTAQADNQINIHPTAPVIIIKAI